MVLNYIWIAFFGIAFLTALIKLVAFGNLDVFPAIMDATFSSSKTAFEISLGLTGVLSLWMGIMKIGEKGGLVNALARWLSPLFIKLFPDLPRNHPVIGNIFMNLAANMLGLDNAATPLGLKAMRELQELNGGSERASDAMVMFLVLNTSGLTIIPISIMMYRSQLGAAQPTDVFVPILIATFVSTLAGLVAVCAWQKINLFNRTLLTFLVVVTLVVAGIIRLFAGMDRAAMDTWSTLVANVFLFTVITVFIIAAVVKKVNVYEAFIEGAKDGFGTAVRIIPYLVAILVAVGVFRASGAMDWLIDGIGALVRACGLDDGFVPALPTALMKPLSGSGARGLMVDAMETYGADSFVGRLVSVMQGSTDTTFYILAVYFGSVGVRQTRHALPCGLIADFAGLTAAIVVSYMFFG